MSRGTIRVRQVVDWSSALWAGLVAGTVLLVANWILAPMLLSVNGWVVVRLYASAVLGDGVLAPPASFDVVALAAALVVHYAVAIAAAVLLAITIYRWGVVAGFVGGALFGVAMYCIGVYVITLALPAFMLLESPVFLLTHVVFGATAGTVYELLEVETFEPIEAEAAS